jgi:NSS family neurotransmitter:Na+ symporter
MAGHRGQWGSRLGFILAAAGSAVGLGNIWSFPYRTGESGGGLFVIVYLICVALIGLPVMMAEIFIGRTAQSSPVGAYRSLSRPGSPWLGLGWLSVFAAFIILSFYSVIAGWSMHYFWVSITQTFSDRTPEEIGQMFGTLAKDPVVCTIWHVIFMVLTISIVIAGVHQGIEAWSKVLMPALFVCLLILLVYAMVKGSFAEGLAFVFKPKLEQFSWTSVLAALGQAFFSLSLGMGALITYGSYLKQDDDLVSTSITVGVLDTSVALLSAIIIFPILIAAGQETDQGPGLVFATLPIAFSNMPGGVVLAPIFFLLLTFAALTSSISLLEVATAYFIDERRWSRTKATLATGGGILVLGIPSAIAGGSAFFGDGFVRFTDWIYTGEGKNWFDSLIDLTFNLMLPLGGLGIALFVAWRVNAITREEGFKLGSRMGRMYWGWVRLLRWLVPIAVILVLLNALGALSWLTG